MLAEALGHIVYIFSYVRTTYLLRICNVVHNHIFPKAPTMGQEGFCTSTKSFGSFRVGEASEARTQKMSFVRRLRALMKPVTLFAFDITKCPSARDHLYLKTTVGRTTYKTNVKLT